MKQRYSGTNNPKRQKHLIFINKKQKVKNKIMTADEARKLTDKNSQNKFTYDLKEVYDGIKNQCESGQDSLSFDGNLSKQTIHELKKNGFKLDAVFHPTKNIPFGFNYYISW